MLVLFSTSPRSIITAYIASRIHHAKPIEKSRSQRFFFEETLDADSLDYNDLYSEHRENRGGLDFLENPKLFEILEDEIFWTSRFNARDRFQLIFKVLELIETKGTKAYLSQEGPEAKEMKDRVRRVTAEFRRAKDFLSFKEDSENKAIIARGTFEHRILDLVLRHFARRKPGYAVAILDEENAHICMNDEILVEPVDKFPRKKGRKDAKRYWQLLSDVRYTDSRKDPDYDVGELPENYWKWVSEDTREIATTGAKTLDDFS
jgi:hypothetical protein